MKTVYALFKITDYEGHALMGVFTTEDKAKTYCYSLTKEERLFDADFAIGNITLDEPII